MFSGAPSWTPDQQRLDAAEHEERGDRPEVEDPDPLVVGRRDPRRPALRLGPHAVRDDLRSGRLDGGAVGDGHSGLVLLGSVGVEAAAAAVRGPRRSPSSCSSSLRPCAAACSAALMSSACRSYQAFHSSYGCAMTRAYMLAWLRPHSSAHWPRKTPGSVTLNQRLVRVARERVHLAAELRDPPRVLDVVRADVERHGHAHRHVHVRVGEDLLVVDPRVRVLPHVLHAVDLDVHRRRPWAAPPGRSTRRRRWRRPGCRSRRCSTRRGS